jgi:hypothetical protein
MTSRIKIMPLPGPQGPAGEQSPQNFDGGGAASIYTQTQTLSGGNAASIYTQSQRINGGTVGNS